MRMFMGVHTFPPNAFSADQVCQLGKAAQNDPTVRGYRSFLSLAEGKAVCILEAPDRESVTSWFKKMNLPTDSVTELDMEGDRGEIHELHAAAQTA
jgi:hypothetical protein